MKYFIILIILLIIFKIIQSFLDKNEDKKEIVSYDFNGKIKDSPLKKAEKEFYKELKNSINLEKYEIFPKLRLADIFTTENISDFNKIKSKTIDFTICDKDLNFVLFIELDNNNYGKNKTTDVKKDAIFKNSNIEILRIKPSEIDNNLKELKGKFK